MRCLRIVDGGELRQSRGSWRIEGCDGSQVHVLIMLTAPVVRSIIWMCPASSWRRNTRCCCLALACIAERSQVRSIRVRAPALFFICVCY